MTQITYFEQKYAPRQRWPPEPTPQGASQATQQAPPLAPNMRPEAQASEPKPDPGARNSGVNMPRSQDAVPQAPKPSKREEAEAVQSGLPVRSAPRALLVEDTSPAAKEVKQPQLPQVQ